MPIDITIKIGGEAGQGIQTVGQLLALVCREAGLFIYGINDFESRIRGGHNFIQIRISDCLVRAPSTRVHMLVAMDENTVALHKDQVIRDGFIIAGRESSATATTLLSVPFSELAQKAGGVIAANTVAAGATLCLLGAPLELFVSVLNSQFAGKDKKIVEQNIAAARLGYEAVQGKKFAYAFPWTGIRKKHMLLEGSQSIALGALAGDCRFVSFYPMSPATSIVLHLASYQDRFPIFVEQAEDEISAVNMIIGASFAGARSLTATSGGGFCLMTEGVGLAGITETPIVIVNAQRPGPATGLATRTAQADLLFVIRAAQDDFPRFVFAPGSPEEGYSITSKAFELSEKYQAPAIILVDQLFNDSLYSIEDQFAVPASVERFIIDQSALDNPAAYNRYALTESGISPRALPCKGKALVKVCGNEHKQSGHTSEAAADRNSMVDKRARKMDGMLNEMRPPRQYYPEAATMLVGWGSTEGAIQEAVDLLRADGIDAGSTHFCDIWPFPTDSALKALSGKSRFFVVEQNSNAQFAQLLRQQTGLVPTRSILKYDGRPFYPMEIYTSALEK